MAAAPFLLLVFANSKVAGRGVLSMCVRRRANGRVRRFAVGVVFPVVPSLRSIEQPQKGDTEMAQSDDEAREPGERISILREVILFGALAIVVGLGVLTWTVYSFGQGPKNNMWTAPAAELFVHLGVAAIVFGLFNIIIGIPDWSRYFEQRLQNIVFKHSYLK